MDLEKIESAFNWARVRFSSGILRVANEFSGFMEGEVLLP
jgi:hypothetical protein